MSNEEAIKYLQQLYPQGGHCWLDEQRIEAINIAVKAIKTLQQKQKDDQDESDMAVIAHMDGVEKGKQMMKEQMLKDAVDAWIFRDIKDGNLRISDREECWNGIRIPEKIIKNSYLICTTDDVIKVKMIIVKEN